MAGEETEFNLDPEADQDQSEFSYCGKDVDIDAKNERSFVANSFAGRFWTITFASIIYQKYFLILIIIVD
ncbi:hypothetical protein Bca52824_086850 [Brassica carinata]|uniref:Uncharacterized protein n=1 Tax=Brassica carinata TaxID=52824 RepID=A0A8X7PA84_BRACI|nr:hypothetical protein Bca52824_086850 [Brassica carinata]